MSQADLEDAVRAAQKARLETIGEPPDIDSDAAAERLLGECQQNAAALRDELQARGIACQVVGGALQNAYPPGEMPPSFDVVRADGFGVHYWVEVDECICELASESEYAYGQPLVTRLPPEKLGYVRFDDSADADISF